MYYSKNLEYWNNLGATKTVSEIAQQPETWLKTSNIIKQMQSELKTFIQDVTQYSNHDIILTGAGTSEFVGNTVLPVLARSQEINVRSIATTDLVADPTLYFYKEKPTLLVSFGRSGNSPESVKAVQLANDLIENVKHLIITCNHEGNLAKRNDDNILVIKLPEETNDKSLAMTSSYSNMYLAALLAFNLNNLETLNEDVKIASEFGESFNNSGYQDVLEIVETFDFTRIVYLGDGQHHGLSQESGLKTLELTAGEIASLFNTPLGFRHGPKSFVNSSTLIVVFMRENEYIRNYQKDLIKEVSIQRLNNQIMVIDTLNDPEIEALVDKYVSINYTAKVSEGLEVLNMVMYSQLISVLKSIDCGLNPDNPSPTGAINRVVEGVIIYDFKEN